MSKKKIIALAMSAVMAVGMIAGCGSTNNSGTDTAQTESTEKVTPTFMYFVANADDNFCCNNQINDKFRLLRGNIYIFVH